MPLVAGAESGRPGQAKALGEASLGPSGEGPVYKEVIRRWIQGGLERQLDLSWEDI